MYLESIKTDHIPHDLNKRHGGFKYSKVGSLAHKKRLLTRTDCAHKICSNFFVCCGINSSSLLTRTLMKSFSWVRMLLLYSDVKFDSLSLLEIIIWRRTKSFFVHLTMHLYVYLEWSFSEQGLWYPSCLKSI